MVSPSGGSASSEEVAFTHEIATSLSNELGQAQPNDILAKNVIDLVLHHASSEASFIKAAATFGLKRREFLSEMFERVKKREGTKFGIFVGHEDDVMRPDAPAAGGLARPGLATAGGGDKHVFKAPSTPARSSVLGLDRLAHEKRQERAEKDEREAKRPRLDNGKAEFKGARCPAFCSARSCAYSCTVPSRPVSANIRQRPDETPSHGPGLSESARQKLEEHRRRRAEAAADSRNERPRQDNDDHLASFRNRANRNERAGPPPPQRRAEGDMRPPGVPARSGDTSILRRYDQTPSSVAPVTNRGWDATPGAATRKSWDSTPRRTERTPREWDTPRLDGVDYPEEQLASPGGGREWDEEQLRLDREWYTREDGQAADDDMADPFAGYDDDTVDSQTKELELSAKRKQQQKITAKQAAYNGEQDAWEMNRINQSGTGGRRRLDFDSLDEEENKVTLLVHDLKPPFLDGRVVFTKQLEPVNPVRDPTSDLAIFSKKGSLLVRETRAKREREKAARKAAELGGTALGNVMGVQEKTEEQAEAEADAALLGKSARERVWLGRGC